jgi:hypothetical protein
MLLVLAYLYSSLNTCIDNMKLMLKLYTYVMLDLLHTNKERLKVYAISILFAVLCSLRIVHVCIYGCSAIMGEKPCGKKMK